MDGFGFVALDGNDAMFDAERAQQDLRADQYLAGMLSHQHVVATDIGFALDTIQNQAVNIGRARLRQLLRGWEHRPTEPDDTALEHACLQDFGTQFVEVEQRFTWFDCAILAVGLDDDARCRVAMAPRDRPGFYGQNSS